MEIVLFIAYFAVVSFAVVRIPFFKRSGIGTKPLLALFALKVAAGIAYARFYKLPRYYAGSDTWRFYRLSLDESKWLLRDPLAFVHDLFFYGYSRAGNVFAGENTYWNDLKSNIPIKLMAVFNVVTFNSYYTNIILFNLLFLVGQVALFRMFHSLFAEKKALIVGCIFLLPSTLFWCSGVHKDGLILSAAGLLVYACFRLFHYFHWKYVATIVVMSLLIFSLRNYVLLALLPALAGWWLSQRYFPRKALMMFGGIYAVGVAAFFLLPYGIPALNLPAYLALKQHEFLQLEGSSVVGVPALQPTFAGFISFLPHALDMALARPHIAEARNFSYIPAALEVLLMIALLLLTLFSVRGRSGGQPVFYFLLFFSATILLICGYTIPFSGAIVRYRSFVYPFLFTPLACRSAFVEKIIKNKNIRIIFSKK